MSRTFPQDINEKKHIADEGEDTCRLAPKIRAARSWAIQGRRSGHVGRKDHLAGDPGGSLVGILAEAMPKTIGAADRVRRSGCPSDVRCRADDLLQGLAAVECYFIAGGAAAVPAGLLRDLVMITAALAGRTWVETYADKTAVFALHAAWQPPPLPELDQILADALSTRSAAGGPRRLTLPGDKCLDQLPEPGPLPSHD